MARPSKLTDELLKELCAAIRWGAYISTACAYVGICEATYKNWKARGKRAKSGKYKRFLAAIKKAEADSEIHSVQGIRKAGKRHWQALAWLNERKFPERWRKRDPHANTIPLITVVEFTSKLILAINKTVKNNEERLALTAEIERLAAELKQTKKPYRRNGNGNGGKSNGD
jgi:hypothetical protein